MNLSTLIQSRVPVLLWGAPGVGKTSAVLQLAESLNLPCEVVIGSIREPSDFSGLPVANGKGVRLYPPAWAVRLSDAGRGILFLDEISTCPPAVQAALLRVVLDRVVGDLALPPEVLVVAAANPPELAAGGWDLAAPIANRFCHLEWSLKASTWCDGIVSGFTAETATALPAGWEMRISAARAQVSAFIRARQQLLFALPEAESDRARAWPSPRSWDMAARVLAACASVGEDGVEGVAGCVGQGAAMEFLAWRRALDLPDPEALLAKPALIAGVQGRDDRLHAALGSVVAAVMQHMTPERWTSGVEVCIAAAGDGRLDVAAVHLRGLIEPKIKPAGAKVPTGIKVFGELYGRK